VDKKVEIYNPMKPELKSSLELESIADLTSSKIDEIINTFVKSE
jgi:propanediol dehydratase small subunit